MFYMSAGLTSFIFTVMLHTTYFNLQCCNHNMIKTICNHIAAAIYCSDAATSQRTFFLLQLRGKASETLDYTTHKIQSNSSMTNIFTDQ